MSSHIFEEVEKTCNNVLIIKDGRIVNQSDVQTLKNSQRKGFIIKPADVASASQLLKSAGFEVIPIAGDNIEVFVTGENVDHFIKTAAQFTILNLDVKTQSLEDIFMHYYGREGK
jgi:ABC-2 type transport system ATP-binding protein